MRVISLVSVSVILVIVAIGLPASGVASHGSPFAFENQSYTISTEKVTVADYEFGENGESLAIWNLSDGTPDTIVSEIVTSPSNGTNVTVNLTKTIDTNMILVAALHANTTNPGMNDILRSEQATIVITKPIADPPNPPRPTDPDDDGDYEDVNGDGSLDVIDVGAYLANRDREPIENHPQKFDYNGDNETNIIDVAMLLEEVR